MHGWQRFCCQPVPALDENPASALLKPCTKMSSPDAIAAFGRKLIRGSWRALHTRANICHPLVMAPLSLSALLGGPLSVRGFHLKTWDRRGKLLSTSGARDAQGASALGRLPVRGKTALRVLVAAGRAQRVRCRPPRRRPLLPVAEPRDPGGVSGHFPVPGPRVRRVGVRRQGG